MTCIFVKRIDRYNLILLATGFALNPKGCRGCHILSLLLELQLHSLCSNCCSPILLHSQPSNSSTGLSVFIMALVPTPFASILDLLSSL
eukprot:6483564-Amphidinium_carterae.3